MAWLASWWVELGTVVVTLAVGIYVYFSIRFQYWKKKGLPYLEPSFPFGNVKDMVTAKCSIGESFKSLYSQLEGNKVAGIYQMLTPVLLIRDPELVKCVTAKDFGHFQDRCLYHDDVRDPISGNLFFVEGQKWRHLRHKLTPTFTSGKMKMMFTTMDDCVQELIAHLKDKALNNEPIEIKEVLGQFTTDVIGTCAFGIQTNSMKNPDSEFRTVGRKIFNPTGWDVFKGMLVFISPTLASLFNIASVPRSISKFFIGIVEETVNYRETNGITRNDFMELMIRIKNKKSVYDGQDLHDGASKNDELLKEEKNMYDEKGMTVEEIAAQAFAFFIAGFETSSATMAFCLYEMAVNPNVQERLRNEIDSVLGEHGGKLTYETLQQLKYLDNVVAETLRKYPPAPTLMRSCTKEYQLPGTDITIDKGTAVFIPVYGIHHDPQHYPDPDTFDPDRFTDEAKRTRHHYAYLPFGEGPRICIGSRFALLQTKIGLASLISKYQFNVSKDTVVPLQFDPKSFILSSAGGIHLQLSCRR